MDVGQASSVSVDLPDHLNEHCYSKVHTESNEPMDTAPVPVTSSEENKGLTQLNQEEDTFETVLLKLLQTFTKHQRQSTSSDDSPMASKPFLAAASPIDISAEALNTLSAEQVMALVTSNSVNYEVIQQIRAQKNPQGDGSKPADSSKGEGGSGGDFNQQLLQVTPEQLQILQSQIAELLTQQKVSIPTELSPEQQLELIQSLLVQQLNSPQPQTAPKTPTTTAPEQPPPTKKPKTLAKTSATKPQTRPPSSKPGSALSSAKRRRESAKKEPKKPPKPYNIFFGEVYSTVMAANPKMTLPESSKIISTMWEAMGEEVKKRYNEAYEKLEEEYQQAMQEYQASNQPEEKPPSTLQQLLKTGTKPSITKSEPSKAKTVSTQPKTTAKIDGLSQTRPPAKIEGHSQAQTEEPSKPPAKTEGPFQVKPPTKVEAQASVPPAKTETPSTEDSARLSERISAQSTTEKVMNEPAIDSKTCINVGCSKLAVFSEDRGPQYCSSECVVSHCRNVFDTWVSSRKVKG